MDSEQEIHRTLGRLESKVDTLISDVQCLNRSDELVDKRVSSLERWRTYLAGAFAALVMACGIAWRLVTHK